MKILSIQVGQPKILHYDGREILTGIQKYPVSKPVRLNFTNLDGDGQADLKVHGGPEKALYAYSDDSYPAWRKMRPQDDLSYGAMGENLTIDSIRENETYVGDTYQIGQARVQACQPRFPCFKLAAKFGDPHILKQFTQINRPGVYYRVLEEGTIQTGDEFKLIHRENVLVSIQELYELKKPATDAQDRIRTILTVKTLSSNWRTKLEGWLNP